MRALVYHGPGQRAWEEVPDPEITTGLVDASSTPTLMRLAAGGQLDAGRFVTHRFSVDGFEQGYGIVGGVARNGALKVVLARREEGTDE